MRTLRADSRCPECGLAIWASVLHTVDPAASRLPSLRNPRSVGDAVMLLTLCMLVGAILLLSPGLAQALDHISGAGTWSAMSPRMSWYAAAALGAVGACAILMLKPPVGSEPRGAVWVDIWRIVVGYFGWLALGAVWTVLQSPLTPLNAWQELAIHLAMGVCAVIGLIGLRGVFRIIGQRSREYRRSKGGRQSLDLIMLAISVGMFATIIRSGERMNWFPGEWRLYFRTINTTVSFIANFMVVIGLMYLVGNAIWIRRALRRPPPPLDQVLLPQVPAGAWIPDREE